MDVAQQRIKRFAALDKDGYVIAFGLGLRFSKHCFSFTNQCFGRWVKGGMRYAVLNVSKFPTKPVHINDIPHQRILRSKVRLTF